VKSNLDLMADELASRNVKFINFYDVVLDYILIDSFEVSWVTTKNQVQIIVNCFIGERQ